MCMSKCREKFCNLGTKQYFLLGARLAFGLWLGYVGTMKWIGGSNHFIGYIQTAFAATWLPSQLVLATGWIIICAEPILGLWLLTGKCGRCAWTCTALLMFMLTFGQTVLQDHATVVNNWHYFIFALACAALADNKECA